MGVESLGRIMAGMTPGQRVPIILWRGGKTINSTMQVRGGGCRLHV
jgi:hypothetical protein